MGRFIRLILGALLAYVIAAPLTSRIQMDLADTAWTDLWTYVIWAFGLFIWLIIFAVGGVLIAGLFALFKR